MSQQLEIQAPDQVRYRIDIADLTRIGRGNACEVRLAFRGVSRLHAEVRRRRGRCVLVDHGSTNGTFVNGSRVDVMELMDSDRIRIGPVRLTFFEEASAVDARQETTLHSAPALDLESLPPSEELPRDALVREYEKHRAAVQLTHRLASERTRDGVVQRVLDYCFESLPVDNGAVLLLDAASGTLRRCAHRATSDDAEVHVSRTVIRELQEHRAGLCVLDAALDPRMGRSASVRELGLRSLLAVPLILDEEVAGAVVLDNRRERRAFDEDDLHVLSGIAAAATLALQRLALLEEIAEEARRRERLERLVAPAVVQQVLDGQLELDGSGRVTDVVVMFADLRGFTPMSRALGPRRTLETLNAFFRVAVAEVDRWQGMVDKFVGDALVAVWGIPFAHPDDAARALRCALAIHRQLQEEPIRGPHDIPVQCGVGVHRGPAVVGMVGTRQRMQYTVIGESVNLCARLCTLAGAGEVLAHSDLVEAVEGPWTLKALPATLVKGFSEKQKLYSVASGPQDHDGDEVTDLTPPVGQD